jgi:hypothetical protein
VRRIVLCLIVLTLAVGSLDAQRDRRRRIRPVSEAAYYVDPDFGGVSTGTANFPWTTVSTTEWAVINTRLAVEPVIVYFSARQASSDTSETGPALTLARTDTSSHRLTLDGVTKWNTDDSTPVWQDYQGLLTRDTPKYHTTDTGPGWAIGWGGSVPIVTMDYVTIRGFETSGASGRIRLEGGGSHMIVEYNYVHDITSGSSPGISFNGGSYAYSAPCTLRIGHLSTDVMFRYNKIVDILGEGLYIGGSGNLGFGCVAHTNITVQGNTIDSPGAFGGEGDCIDIKNGMHGITVIDNILIDCPRIGISILGRSVGIAGPQTVLVERNVINGIGSSSLGSGCISVPVTWETVPDGVTIRNNLCYNIVNARGCISTNDGNSNTDGDGKKYDIYIYNNTCHTATGGTTTGLIGVRYVATGAVINNVNIGQAADTAKISLSNSTSVTENYNAVYPSGVSGAQSITLSGGQASAMFEAIGSDYRLAVGAAALETGTDLSATFSADLLGVTRPQSTLWDMGAYERVP